MQKVHKKVQDKMLAEVQGWCRWCMEDAQRPFLAPSATTFHQMLGSSGGIKKWRKHPRVGESIEKMFAQSVQNIFSERNTTPSEYIKDRWPM